MKYFFLTFMFFASLSTVAQSAVTVTSTFQSAGPKIISCNLRVTNPVVCVDSPAAKSKMTWTNTSISDWAGTVMRTHLSVLSSAVGIVAGSVKFTYTPEDKLIAIAIKQSSGADDIIVTGQIDDFTDVEGRRIISLSPGRAVEIEMPVKLQYSNVGQVLTKDFMVEVEPTEYLGIE